MAATRYGRIYHSDYSYINLRFASADERKTFTEKFNAYHASHDHDGVVPRFENEVASKIGNPESTTIHDAHSVSIDGYATYEIEEYHNPGDSIARRGRYKPPTCCVAPVISVDRTFVQSDALTRHELSAIFTDIPDEEFASMLQSIERDGFMDPIIRLIGTEVLDGWHRYSAAKELNLLRKLRFQQWNKKDEGDPAAFVYARNQHRRHQSAAKRAQITVFFNERYGHGTNRYTLDSPNGESNPDVDVPNGTSKPKTREELAKEAGVGVRTIARAIEVDKEGESEAVIKGEKTAGEVIKARDAATAKKRKKQVLKNLWDIRKQAATDYVGDSDNDLNQYLTQDDLEKGFVKNNETYAEAFQSGMKRIDAAAGSGFKGFEDRAFEVDEFGNAKVDISDLEAEHRAIMTYAGDIRQWQRPDWSPDTNWILPLIEAKKKAKVSKEETTPSDKEQEFAEDQQRAKEAELQMWDALESVAPDWAKDDFAAAACDKMDWGVTEFPDILETDIPAVWRARFELLRNEINLPADWIQQMLTKMAETQPEPDLKELREQVKAQMSKYKEWYKDTGYQESDLVSRASFSQFMHVYREYREIEQGGAATIEELKDLLGLLKQKSYPFAHKLRQIVRPEQSESDPAEAPEGLSEKIQQVRSETREYLPKWRQDNPGNEDATLFVLLDARFRLEHGIQRGTGPFFFEEVEALLALMKSNDLALADKVREMLGTGSGVNSTDDPSTDDRMDRCRSDLLEVWQQEYTWEGLEIPLYVEEYGIGADVIDEMQKEIAAEHPKPTSPTDAGCEVIDESDEDTSIAEINNLPAVKHFLESLQKQVGTVENQITRDDFSVCVFDALIVDSELTEREQLSILIDCALSIVMESESTSF